MSNRGMAYIGEMFYNDFLFRDVSISIKELPFKIKKHTRIKQIIKSKKRFKRRILNCNYTYDDIVGSDCIITVYEKQ